MKQIGTGDTRNNDNTERDERTYISNSLRSVFHLSCHSYFFDPIRSTPPAQHLPIQPTSLVQAIRLILPPSIKSVLFIEPALLVQPLLTEPGPLPVQPISSPILLGILVLLARLFVESLQASRVMRYPVDISRFVRLGEGQKDEETEIWGGKARAGRLQQSRWS